MSGVPSTREPTTLDLLGELLDVLGSIIYTGVALACAFVWVKGGFGFNHYLALGLGAYGISLLHDIRAGQRRAVRS